MSYTPGRFAKLEVILTLPNGVREIYETDNVYEFDCDGHVPYELTIRAGSMTITKKEAPMLRAVKDFKPGDNIPTLGVVEEVGIPTFIAGHRYLPVSFKEDEPRVLKETDKFLITSDGTVSGYPSRTLVIEKSHDPEQIYLKIVDEEDGGGSPRGIWVDREAVREALDNPRDPE